MIARAATRLYVHVPFCRAKCGYCAFYSEAPAARPRMDAYLERLDREFRDGAGHAAELDSVFLGGGTPALLGPLGVRRLMAGVQDHFRLAASAEVSMEANPDVVSPALAEALAEAGVNRVSLGLQTFHAELRRVLGRLADTAGAPAAVAALRGAGIARLNADLIFQIPGQTLAQWREDLRRALDLGVTHLSAYALTVEEGTQLARGLPASPPADDGLFEEMWHAADAEAACYGLRRYEISNFARPGDECRHNLGIWYGDAYLGCGPAAASFDGRRRWANPADLDAWGAGAVPEVDDIPAPARAAEILAFGLRTVAGWELARLRAVTDLGPDEICPDALRELVAAGLLEYAPGVLRATAAGLLLHDAIAERIILLPGS